MKDGRTRYNKITKMLESIVGKKLPIGNLHKRIMIDIGSSEKVIRDTMKSMIQLGMIKEVESFVYLIVCNEVKF